MQKYQDREERDAINKGIHSRMHPNRVYGSNASHYNAFRMDTENAFRSGQLASHMSPAKPRIVSEPKQPRMFLTTPLKPMGMHSEQERNYGLDIHMGLPTRGPKGRVTHSDNDYDQIHKDLVVMPQNKFTQNHVNAFHMSVDHDVSRQGAATRVNTKSAGSHQEY